MIVFDQVSKRYSGSLEALAGVSFQVSAGELAVVSGHSGAGKSTLLRLIAAIDRPTSGRVLVKGQDVGRLAHRAIPYLRRKLGLILQENRLLLDRSAADNVMLPLIIAGTPWREAVKRTAAALERVGLAGRAGAMPVALSGGEQQRLAIARAIVSRPPVLIADEPTAHLDEAYAREIAALLQSFNESGVTVLVTTHDETLFAPIAHHRLKLVHGRLSA
ncbi:MAG: ATP-binding cassette domain-containing protein [Zoogloea sp.]|nr:ATP-binding cassette domain-containing protein [Zoogloea sp.]